MNLASKTLVRLAGGIVGLAAGLALLEGILALASLAVAPSSASNPAAGGSGLTVLCVGDSFTYGVGASSEQSYPSHLASLLTHETDLASVSVVNCGRPGVNSSQVVAQLARALRQVQPKLVLVLAGGANYFNFWGRGDAGSDGWTAWISRLRIGRLALRLADAQPSETKDKKGKAETFDQFKNRIERGALFGYTSADHYVPHLNRISPEPPRGASLPPLSDDHQQRLVWAKRRVAHQPKACRYAYAGAEVLAENHRYERARAWLRDGLERNDDCAILYYFMGVLTASRGDGHLEGILWHQKGIAADPTLGHNYFGIAEIHAMRAGLDGDPSSAAARRMFDQAIGWFERGAAADPRLAAEAKRLTAHLRDQMAGGASVQGWIRRDLNRAAELAQSAGATPVLLTYPQNRRNRAGLFRCQRLANRAARDLARQRGLALVDLARAFAHHPQRDQLFAEDVEHPNARGYQLMAQRIFTGLVQRHLVAAP